MSDEEILSTASRVLQSSIDSKYAGLMPRDGYVWPNAELLTFARAMLVEGARQEREAIADDVSFHYSAFRDQHSTGWGHAMLEQIQIIRARAKPEVRPGVS